MNVLGYMFVALLSFGLSVCISFVLHYWLWPTATKGGAAARKPTSKEGKVSNASAAESSENERKVRRRKEPINQGTTEILSVEDKDEPHGGEKPESENDREESHCGAQPPADNQPNEDTNLPIDSIVQQLATAFPNATFAGNDSAFMYMSAFETIDRPTEPTDDRAQVQECITTTTAETTSSSLDSDHRHTDVEEEFWAKCNNTDFCQICSTTFTFFLRRHHCRMCYSSICASCSPATAEVAGFSSSVRVCNQCLATLSKKTESVDEDEEDDHDDGDTSHHHHHHHDYNAGQPENGVGSG